jgi:hypothetical protein
MAQRHRKIFWNRSNNAYGSTIRLLPFYTMGVEQLSWSKIRGRKIRGSKIGLYLAALSILSISYNRIPKLEKMETNLVGTTCFGKAA